MNPPMKWPGPPRPIDSTDRLDFGVGPWHQDDTISLDALVLAASELAFDRRTLVDQASPQPVAGRATLAEPEFDEAALASEHLGRQFPAVFAGHRALDALDDGRDRTSVIFELLGAVLDGNSGPLADVFVSGTQNLRGSGSTCSGGPKIRVSILRTPAKTIAP